MPDDFFNCPFTGGQMVCNPDCIIFIRSGTDNAPYCRKFGRISKIDKVIIEQAEKGGENRG